jgi:hypothetical protein
MMALFGDFTTASVADEERKGKLKRRLATVA